MHIDSPLLSSTPLSAHAGRPIFLKMDALQPAGSFKIRGIGRVCTAAYARGERRFVAASGGNAGLAVAYAARTLGAEAVVVVPRRASPAVIALIKAEGAEVIVHGDIWDEAHAYAVKLVGTRGGRYVHPFEDSELWAGHATLIAELARAEHKPDALVVSVGGGGLLCGVLQGLHGQGWTDVPVIAVETEGAAGFNKSMAAGHPVVLDELTSIATTLSSRVITPKVFEWTRRHRVIPVIVSDREAVNACKRFLEDQRVLVEPACGAALAVIYERRAIQEFSSVTVVVCGGAGVSPDQLARWDADV